MSYVIVALSQGASPLSAGTNLQDLSENTIYESEKKKYSVLLAPAFRLNRSVIFNMLIISALPKSLSSNRGEAFA